MAEYRIICANKAASRPYLDHTHIVGVGTGSVVGRYDNYWTVDQVIHAISRADIFYTISPSRGLTAIVEVFLCSRCNRYFIRSRPDAVTDNNLDNLSYCVL